MKRLLIILLLSISVHAQENPKHLLGEAEPSGIKRTPLGFNYIDNGFGRLRAKKIKKSVEYLRRRGVPESTIQEFADYAKRLGDPQFIPNAIDASWRATQARWLACGQGSKAAKAIRDFDPRKVTIIVEAGSFWVPYWSLYANGMVPDTKTIRATAVAMHAMKTPESASLVRFDALLLWELPNLVARITGYKITAISQEVGDKQPCNLIH